MLTVFARPFVLLGEQIKEMRAMFIFKDKNAVLSVEDLNELQEHLSDLLETCDKLGMSTSKELIIDAKQDPPRTDREFDLLTKALYAEMRDKLLVIVPPHRRKYFSAQDFVGPTIKGAFPSAYAELRLAGQCLAVGQFTACAFHSLRAVEIGLRIMARQLDVSLSFPLDQADWETLIRCIESKVQGMKDLKKGPEKDEMLHFYSNACMPFRYFKDGSRLRVFHARELYDEPRAIALFQHSRECNFPLEGDRNCGARPRLEKMVRVASEGLMSSRTSTFVASSNLARAIACFHSSPTRPP